MDRATRQHLIDRLKQVGVDKVILFGSHASGRATEESDIDLLVVTDDDCLPENFAEKNRIYLRVAEAVTELKKQVPIDLIVHTRAMHRKFLELDSQFARTIRREGIILYEKTH